LTKQAPDEAALKPHVPLEGAKLVESTAELVCNEALVICGAHVKPIEESVPKIAPVTIRVNSLRSKVERIMHKLYDLEPDGEPEKPLHVDLDLYQMENY
jgi:hypothetical protein